GTDRRGSPRLPGGRKPAPGFVESSDDPAPPTGGDRPGGWARRAVAHSARGRRAVPARQPRRRRGGTVRARRRLRHGGEPGQRPRRTGSGTGGDLLPGYARAGRRGRGRPGPGGRDERRPDRDGNAGRGGGYLVAADRSDGRRGFAPDADAAPVRRDRSAPRAGGAGGAATARARPAPLSSATRPATREQRVQAVGPAPCHPS